MVGSWHGGAFVRGVDVDMMRLSHVEQSFVSACMWPLQLRVAEQLARVKFPGLQRARPVFNMW